MNPKEIGFENCSKDFIDILCRAAGQPSNMKVGGSLGKLGLKARSLRAMFQPCAALACPKSCGPSCCRYHLGPATYGLVHKILSRAREIALELSRDLHRSCRLQLVSSV